MSIKIHTTLDAVAANSNNFSAFCEEFGYDEYAVRERGGYGVQVILTPKQAHRYGLLKLEDV